MEQQAKPKRRPSIEVRCPKCGTRDVWHRLPRAGDMRKRNPSDDAERRFFLLVEQALGVHQ